MKARVHAQLELKSARDRLRDENAWLENQIALRLNENQRLQSVSLRALTKLAATRDNETGSHILRTQSYVRILCDELRSRELHTDRLTDDGIRFISMAAPLHDIGKVGIPDRILLKPGKLDGDEWAIMKTHAALGADAIRNAIAEEEGDQQPFGFLLAAIEIANYHHERWDGTGYPEGRAGEDIPLPARLMALADVFDALISKRVYKEAMSIDEATAIIIEGSGTHFDPIVVDAFLSRRAEFLAAAERYADDH